MKRYPGEKLEHYRHRIMMSRTATIFRHQIEIANKTTIGQCAEFDYDLAKLRQNVELALRMKQICRYCGDELKAKMFSLDHRIPISRGGPFSFSNLALICLKCNRTKGQLTEAEFSQLTEMLRSWSPDAKADVLRRLHAGGGVAIRKQTLRVVL